jgi:hypothetical protein
MIVEISEKNNWRYWGEQLKVLRRAVEGTEESSWRYCEKNGRCWVQHLKMLRTIEDIKDIWRRWGRQLVVLRMLKKTFQYLEGNRRYLRGRLKMLRMTVENLQTGYMLVEICSGIFKQIVMYVTAVCALWSIDKARDVTLLKFKVLSIIRYKL